MALIDSAIVNPVEAGAELDVDRVDDAAVAGGALSTVTSASAGFTPGDTGKVYTLSTTTGTITKGTLTYVNATTCTMSVAAGGAMSGARLIWGTDDTSAWQDALDNATPGQVVGPADPAFRSMVAGNLVVPEGVHLGLTGLGPFSPDTNVVHNTWGPTLVWAGDSDPAILLEQGSGVGDLIMFDAMQVPSSADTPVARDPFIEVDVDTLPWSSRQTRVTGCRIGSPHLVNPYTGIYLKGGGHLVDAPQIGGLYTSMKLDHIYDFVSIRRIKADRLACIENPGLGAAGLNVWYQSNAWALRSYRADGWKVHEISTYSLYGGIEVNDSPDGAQDPNALSAGYGQVGIAELDSVVIGMYIRSTQSPGVMVAQANIGPNVNAYGPAGSYGIWLPSGGGTAPVALVSAMNIRGSWSVAATQADAGTLLKPATNPGR